MKESEVQKLSQIIRIFNSQSSRWSKEFDAYDEGYRMLSGDHYTAEQKTYFEPRRRPTNVYNIIFPVYNAVLGDFIIQPFKEYVYAYRGADPRVATLLEKWFENIAINTEWKHEFGKTILAGLIKRGYAYPRFSDELEIDGSIVIKNVDEYEVMFDDRCQDYYLRDAMYLLRTRWMTRSEILAAWPNKRSDVESSAMSKEDSDFASSLTEEVSTALTSTQYIDERNGRYRVIEFHEKSLENMEVAFNQQTGEANPFTLTGQRRDLFLHTHPELKLINRKDFKIKITECVPGLNMIMNQKDADIQDRRFDIIPFSAYHYAKETINHYGMMKNAVGIAKEFDDTRNQILNILNKTSHNDEIILPEAFSNWEEIKAHWGEPGLKRLLKKDFVGKIDEIYKKIEHPTLPTAYDQFQNESMDLLSRILGISDNFWGETQTANENASLFAQRVQQVRKGMGVMDHNIRRTQNMIWSRVIKLIQKNYRQEQVVVFMDQRTRTPEEVTINQDLGNEIINDIRLGEYRVFPSDEERDPTMRTAKFMQRMEIAKLVAEWWGPQAVPPKWLLHNSPVEDAEDLIAAIEQAMGAVQDETQKQAAFNEINALMQTVKQKQELEKPEPEEKNPVYDEIEK